MSKDLTNSALDRQNILNNPYALAEIEKATGIRGISFEGKTVVLKDQVAAFFEVTPRTVDNYLEQNAEELAKNGYEVISGKRLQALKLAIRGMDDHETNFVIIAKKRKISVTMSLREASRRNCLRSGLTLCSVALRTMKR